MGTIIIVSTCGHMLGWSPLINNTWSVLFIFFTKLLGSFFFFFNPHMRIFFFITFRESGRKGGREEGREKKREGETSMLESYIDWLPPT